MYIYIYMYTYTYISLSVSTCMYIYIYMSCYITLYYINLTYTILVYYKHNSSVIHQSLFSIAIPRDNWINSCETKGVYIYIYIYN